MTRRSAAGPPPRVVAFPSAGAVLRGLLYEPAGGGRRPAIVMAHGFSATAVGMVADRYAEAFAAAGMTVLLFDHRGLGLSGGEPRQHIDAWGQAIGYRDALDYVASLPSVDPSRLAVWGDSMSGAVAVCVAALDERVRVVLAQVPACGAVHTIDPDPSSIRVRFEAYQGGGPSLQPVERLGPTAVVSADQLASPSLLTPVTAFRWFIDYGARPGTGWCNWATLDVHDPSVALRPAACAPFLRAASLWLVAVDDEMPGAEPEVARAAFDVAGGDRTWLETDGGHFGLLYWPSARFDRSVAAQVRYLSACL